MSNDDLYRLVFDFWGYEAQIDMCIEESSELIKALCKYKRVDKNCIEEAKAIRNIAEEIADVEIMLEQMKLLFGVYEQVEIEKQHKLMRLEERLRCVDCKLTSHDLRDPVNRGSVRTAQLEELGHANQGG